MTRLNRITVISLLAEKDMQKKELAAKTGLNRNTISAICSGKRCSDATAKKIADALGVEVKELTNN